MFAVREVPTESLGFSPNELVFGHRVQGPLAVMKDGWSEKEESEPLLDFVCRTRERLQKALQLARENLVKAQGQMKKRYDGKVVVREFSVGDEVLVLLPVQGKPLSARFHHHHHHQCVVSLKTLTTTEDHNSLSLVI